MPKRARKQPKKQVNGRPRDSFRWPSRQAAHASERAAAVAAERGLQRLRARSAREEPEPATEPPPARPAPQRESPPPAPEPWEAEYDRLAEELVRGLRRDLGPA